MINEAVLQDVREKLERRAAALNSMQFAGVIQKDFSFKKIRAGLGKKEISDWICASLGEDFSHAAIYRLTVDNAAGAGRLRSAFADYNPQNGHVQTRNNNVDDSNTIYVGSSRKIAQRLRQHLFNCPPSTYALKMHLWCPAADNLLRVEVSAARGDVDKSLLQYVEDFLWTSSRPMFGKLGAR